MNPNQITINISNTYFIYHILTSWRKRIVTITIFLSNTTIFSVNY